MFSGDTGVSDDFWKAVNQQKQLKHLIIETSFLDQEEVLAVISGHLSPSLLISELRKLDPQACHPDAKIWVCHLKPDGGDAIMQEIDHHADSLTIKPQKLTRGTTLSF